MVGAMVVATAGNLVGTVACTAGNKLGALVASSDSHGQLGAVVGAVVGTIVSFAGAVSSVGNIADDGTLVA